MKLSLTTWERTILPNMFMFAPASERTVPGVKAMQDIQARLKLTDAEKKTIGYVQVGDKARWADEEYEAEIEFTSAEWHYISATMDWFGWPYSDNVNALWDKIEAAQKPEEKKK